MLPFLSKNKKGFTLIELLVVIAIIGILASIGITTYNGALERARIAEAQSTVKELYNAIKSYHINTNDWPPDGNNIDQTSEWNDSANGLVPDYIQSVPDDPWGQPYFYDGDPDIEPGQWQTSVCSGGPDGTITSHNTAGPLDDDICLYNLMP